ncbi:MAG TPA: hypothetical protein PLU35_09565 [Phycisphaerales bacterium]|nr:hypothetical protein [Phycisphaerales bacterium]
MQSEAPSDDRIDITSDVLPERDSRLDRVLSTVDGWIISSTQGTGQSRYDGRIGEARRAGEGVSELVALGQHGDYRDGRGWSNLSPRLVAVSNDRKYIINLVRGPSFGNAGPSKANPADYMTGNVVVFAGNDKPVVNLTKLGSYSGLFASAVAWFEDEGLLLTVVSDVNPATGIASPRRGTERPHCINLEGVYAGTPAQFPRIHKFYEAWSSTRLVGRRHPDGSTRWFVIQGEDASVELFRCSSEESNLPVAFPLSLDARMLVAGSNGYGTWLVRLGDDAEARKVSDADLVSVDPLGGTVIMRTGTSLSTDGRVWLADLRHVIGEGEFDCPPTIPLNFWYGRVNE